MKLRPFSTIYEEVKYIHTGIIVGQSLVAIIGIVLGLYLLYKWLKTRNRSMIHFAVYFIGCSSYLFRAFIDLGYGNAEVLSRALYLVGMTAIYVGVFPGVLLMLPSTRPIKNTIYKVVSPSIFFIVLLVTVLAPAEQTEVGLYVFKHPYHLIFVRLLHGAIAPFAVGGLLYLSYKIKDVRPAVMAFGFIFVLLGSIFMGRHEGAMAIVGSVVQALGLVIFFFALVVASKLHSFS